jgi:nucleoside recognition membrane protein YjiH
LISGWNGLSVHAQITSMISRTDIRYYPYFAAKILHGFLAALITIIIFPFFNYSLQNDTTILSVFHPVTSPVAFSVWGILQGFAVTVTLIWFLALVYQETKAVAQSFRYNKTR